MGASLLAAALFTGAYYLTKLGPKKIDPSNISVEYDEVAADELLLDIQRKEERFRLLAEQRPPTDEDFKMLDEAINGLTEYISMRGGSHGASNERREDLYDLRDEYRGKALYEQSVALELESNNAKDAGNSEEALRLLERSVYLQRQLNERFPRSKRNDTRRLTRLGREVELLTAKPIYDRSIAAEEAANKELDAENFDQAKRKYAEAIDLQTELNLRFRSLQYADIRRLSRLEQELASLESSDLYERIQDYISAAKSQEEQGNYAATAENYQNAFRLQRQLNQDFPKSRFAAVRLTDELQAKRENALSRDLGDGIKADMQQLDQALRERTVWRAIEIIRTLYPKVQQFNEQFPRSTFLGQDALLKMQYLSAVEDDISFLQDRLHGQLLPVEGVKGWRMLRTEVSQALYMSVMLKANPSRHVGDTLPVDSGNWEDATSFAQRVSWLLGYPARLPTEDEFYAAVGSLRYVDLREVSWCQENAGGVTHEIATKKPNGQGFHDLLGNVSEWLLSESLPGEGEAYVAGGSVETPVDDLADKPVEISNRRMRNRFAGFRIVVELPEE